MQQEELKLSISDSGSIVIDRSKSGLVDFSENFFAEIKADFIPKEINEVELYVDASSVEIFINKGERVMTARMFNQSNYRNFRSTKYYRFHNRSNGLFNKSNKKNLGLKLIFNL